MRAEIGCIKEYQKKLGYDYERMTQAERMQMFRNYMAALTVEQGELAAEVPWKPWRAVEDQKDNYRKQCLEWVDSFFFLVDQALALKLDPQDLEDTFIEKMFANHKRIESGYNNKAEDR
ncbi:MAG: dUTP diphosphatase [Thiomicrorhabdus sp.]|jgi:dimeric dUTPase (all-alpha-NTP-PPase superfamily)|nr:dUTP diphosphatase [Thiomicrorhabdus sp.]